MNSSNFFKALINELTISEQIELRDMLEDALSPKDDGGTNYELNMHLIKLGAAGDKLKAVVYCKDTLKIGLKEAKDYCDALWAKG